MVLDDADRLMSIDEVAARLATSPGAVSKLINNGHIPYVKMDRRRYVRKSRLSAVLDKIERVGFDELLKGKSEELTRAAGLRIV